ncbi:helix-turn-helix transcriptional regulator [Bradyrhizobium sp. UFLA05-112]
MNRPILETQVEREFLLGQLSPEGRRRVREVMQKQGLTAEQAIQMLGIGEAALGFVVSTTEDPEFLLSQLSSHDRAASEQALACHPARGMSKLPLSPREKQFLRRLAAGKTDAQIAERLGGTAKQVAEQRVRLLAKLGISAPDEIADAAEQLASFRTYRGVT